MSEESPVIFGEVLFDVFEGKKEVLGGAPFNVAWHLQGFGVEPLFVSRVGEDERGEKILNAMNSWGMRTDGIQEDREHPTGVVSVTTENGHPEYEIKENQAYDYIDFQQIKKILASKNYPWLYHGTLALRNQVSYQTLRSLKTSHANAVFIDVNLRASWWTGELLIREVKNTDWLKCNDEELKTIAGILGISGSDENQLSSDVMEKLNLETMVITRGDEGAFLMARGKRRAEVEPAPIENLVDTVGAGDAFSAVCILGLLRHWSARETLAQAVEFAAEICQIQGATAKNPDLYSKFK